MKKLLKILLVLLSLGLVACGADDPGDSDNDTMDATVDTTGDQTGCVDDVTVQSESPNSEQEFADCFTGCSHTRETPIINLDNAEAIRGVLDGECHEYSNGSGPDIDIMSFSAPARTMLEVIVEPAACSNVDPLIQLHNSASILTFNDMEEEGGVAARTMIAAPTVNELPIFLSVQDASNYENFDPQQSFDSCDQFVGGDDFAYLVKVNRLPWSPTELGDASGGSVSGTGALTRGGDIVYFTFMAPPGAEPSVTVTSTGDSEFVPVVVPMNTANGEMRWRGISYDEDGDGTHTITGDFVACEMDCGMVTEYAFAVLDWNGAPGNFTFDVQVSL